MRIANPQRLVPSVCLLALSQLILALLANSWAAACDHSNRSTTPVPPHIQLKLDVATAIKASAPLSAATREESVKALVELHAKIANHDDLFEIDRVEMLLKLKARLRQINAALIKEIAVQDAIARRNDAASAFKATSTAKRARATNTNRVAAHTLNTPAPAASELPGSANLRAANQAAQRTADVNLVAAQVRAQQPVVAQQIGFGGFGNNNFGNNGNRGNNGGGIAAQPADHGRALVELIQRTIAPESWDVNGGLGAVVYYRRSQALVVRQRAEVHEQLDGVIRGLRE